VPDNRTETHLGCGRVVYLELQWWPEWMWWVWMSVCTLHGGPIVESEIIRG